MHYNKGLRVLRWLRAEKRHCTVSGTKRPCISNSTQPRQKFISLHVTFEKKIGGPY